MPRRPAILFVTDLGYQARGRRYCDEDIFLTSRLRHDFDLALCHPLEAAALMEHETLSGVALDAVLSTVGEADSVELWGVERTAVDTDDGSDGRGEQRP